MTAKKTTKTAYVTKYAVSKGIVKVEYQPEKLSIGSFEVVNHPELGTQTFFRDEFADTLAKAKKQVKEKFARLHSGVPYKL